MLAAADSRFVVMLVLAVLGMVGAGVGLLAAAFWLGMIVNVCWREEGPGGDRLGWILAVILLPVLGALVYYVARYRRLKRARSEAEGKT